jgi:Amt family ammonium transporter
MKSLLVLLPFFVAMVAAQECPPSSYVDTNGTCIAFSSPSEKVAQNFGAPIDTGDTAWMLTSSALVMLMTPGLGFFYGGMSGVKNISNTLMMCFVSMAIVTLQWVLIGYSFSFAPYNAGFGNFDWGALVKIGQYPSGAYAPTIPHLLYTTFQNMFAQITPALISGAVIGRMKFSAFVIFVFVWTTCVYDPLAHWVWSLTINSEWAVEALGVLGRLPSIDFAGGTVIHIASGVSALVAAIMLGKRYNADEKKPEHNVLLVMIGTALLWFGWWGFNAGSAGAANGIAALAFINTHIAACMGLLTWITVEYILEKQITPVGAANGVVAALVCITPACGYINVMSSIAFGVFGPLLSYTFIMVKEKLRYDDVADAFAIHGISGIVGAFMTGLFANSSVNPAIPNGAFFGNPILLAYQLAAIGMAIGISGVGTAVIMLALKYTIGIRVSENKEKIGLDASYHGGNKFVDETVPPPIQLQIPDDGSLYGSAHGGSQFTSSNPPSEIGA